MAIFCNISMC